MKKEIEERKKEMILDIQKNGYRHYVEINGKYIKYHKTRLERYKKANHRIKNCLKLLYVLLILICIIWYNDNSDKRELIKDKDTNITSLQLVIKEKNTEIDKQESVIQELTNTISAKEQEDITDESNRGSYNHIDYSKVDKDFKSFMDYRAITDTSSNQYNFQQYAYTDLDGFRKINEHYCVALGSYYGGIGSVYLVTLDNGYEFTVVKADEKQDIHTDENNQVDINNGSVLEFIVEKEKLNELTQKMGNCNYSGFEGKIESMVQIQ